MNNTWTFKEIEPQLLLFQNVSNTAEIREKIVKAKLPCAAINPRYVLDTSQMLIATQLAVISQQNQALKTHSIFSEIVYNMSPNKKISESLKKFGIDEKDTTFFCVVLNKVDMELVCSTVAGDKFNLAEYNHVQRNNEHELKKLFKIKEEELKVASLLDAIINRTSTKDLVTF